MQTMTDSQIIDLFLKRLEQAITETDSKYGALCFQISRNILDNPEIKASMEEKSYEKFNNSFTLERMWSGYKEIYERVSKKVGKK